MPLIQKFRIGNDQPEKDSLEFYIKINNKSNHKLLNLRVSGTGLYYYKWGSHILTPKENKNTRNTYDGYLPIATITKIFEKLSEAGWSCKAEKNKSQKVKVSVKPGRVILKVVKS